MYILSKRALTVIARLSSRSCLVRAETFDRDTRGTYSLFESVILEPSHSYIGFTIAIAVTCFTC